MKINEEEFSKVCAEVISDLVADEELNGDSKVMVMLVSTMVLGKIKNKLFSETEEIEIVKE